MIYLKTDEEIELMRKSNQLVGMTLGELAKWIQPGVTTQRLDEIAEQFIRDHGAIPGFKGYGGFPSTLCISVNDKVVHGFPSAYELKDGDIISVDCGVTFNGYNGRIRLYTFSS
jgi:Methionine aminopeptidase